MNVFLGCLKRLIRRPLNLLFLLVFPVIFTALVYGVSGDALDSAPILDIGVVDLDGSTLSQAVTEQLALRYACTALSEEALGPALSEEKVSWALRIPAGFQRDLLAGRAPTLEGSAIAVSDAQALASASAERLVHALLVLAAGADEADLPALLRRWEAASAVAVVDLPRAAGWSDARTWIAFHGWISLLTAFFLVRTLMEDRKEGLPERVGVLPMSRQRYLLQNILAVLALCEVSSALLLLGVGAALGGGIPHPAHLFLLLSMYNLFATGFSFGLFALCKRQSSASVSITMLSVLMAMLGGTYWPVEIMPPAMRKIAYFSPNYWLSLGLKRLEVLSWDAFWLPVLLLALFAVVAFLLGSWRRVERTED